MQIWCVPGCQFRPVVLQVMEYTLFNCAHGLCPRLVTMRRAQSQLMQYLGIDQDNLMHLNASCPKFYLSVKKRWNCRFIAL